MSQSFINGGFWRYRNKILGKNAQLLGCTIPKLGRNAFSTSLVGSILIQAMFPLTSSTPIRTETTMAPFSLSTWDLARSWCCVDMMQWRRLHWIRLRNLAGEGSIPPLNDSLKAMVKRILCVVCNQGRKVALFNHYFPHNSTVHLRLSKVIFFGVLSTSLFIIASPYFYICPVSDILCLVSPCPSLSTFCLSLEISSFPRCIHLLEPLEVSLLASCSCIFTWCFSPFVIISFCAFPCLFLSLSSISHFFRVSHKIYFSVPLNPPNNPYFLQTYCLCLFIISSSCQFRTFDIFVTSVMFPKSL